MNVLHLVLALLGSCSLLACAADVDLEPGARDGGAGGGAAATSASTATGGCGDRPELVCAWGCGSDAASEPECTSAGWRCPEGTVDAASCPADTCWGPPLACEACDEGGWTCSADPSCADEGIVCAECPADLAPFTTTAPDGAELACACRGPEVDCVRCCTTDADCRGDDVCAFSVCKPRSAAPGCWSDAECPDLDGLPYACSGLRVCSCGQACDLPDEIGQCERIYAP